MKIIGTAVLDCCCMVTKSFNQNCKRIYRDPQKENEQKWAMWGFVQGRKRAKKKVLERKIQRMIHFSNLSRLCSPWQIPFI